VKPKLTRLVVGVLQPTKIQYLHHNTKAFTPPTTTTATIIITATTTTTTKAKTTTTITKAQSIKAKILGNIVSALN